MKYQDNKELARNDRGVVITAGRAGWVAGMRWTQSDTGTGPLARLRMKSTHFLNSGGGPDRVTGLVSPGKIRHIRQFYSLAAAFLQSVGGSSYGTYRIDEARWVFLATVSGRMTVMGDVVGSLNDVQIAESRFLSFNEPGADEWNCVARSEDDISCLTLINAFPSRKRALIRLRIVSPVLPAVLLSVLVVSASAGLWLKSELDRRASDAAFEEAMKSKSTIVVNAPEKPVLPHPWAIQYVMPEFLRLCWSTREPLYASVAGWRLSAGSCDEHVLRLNYVATQGSTVEDFDRRVKELFGRSASFNLKDGGKEGSVEIPFEEPGVHALRDEPLGSADDQLKRFISHLQRRNVPVQFSEVMVPEPAPGAKADVSSPDWREFSFTLSSRLAAEWLLSGLDDSGIRLSGIAFSMSPQGQFDYTIRGSLYAKK
ncbi:type 4b pilus protein PilO2 [Phytobacter diazotrophicus]|uniref:type 4b pilus protein PilO2 n=1 Tax=Phytobacter diazotrophicus TaxID=395631 RepID=UPI002908E582|nr:type 4b pilus protein PilO2 [Enterobacteriaceae bacterium]MDU4355625.1 type 4b pilus protein PilO2 [Phytobacter diazotrophicus]